MVAWIAGAAMAWFAAGGDVEWVAHRGESADAPENTLSAFRLAWERGVKAIELDVHLAKDGTLIVCHDADTRRTTGERHAIKESTREQLKGLDAGSWKDPKFKGEPVPTLDEALATIPEDGRCFIEVKVGAEAIPALVKSIRQSGKKPGQLAVISFQADAVAESKKQLPEIKAYFLSSFKKDEKAPGGWTPSIDSLIAKAKELKADGLDLAAKGPLDAAAVAKIKQSGLEIYTWTVDDPAEARRLAEAGVDGITTNKAGWMKSGAKGE
ncbi:glycerophosphodiester phosphodiesterase [Tundrisphaera sp. TA3]|uniref:glycerophosphodiester phosphodiesterase n=1 Tax=Tundrisphaera sp. TA3 TaxID=3435775 RepID=UPI003EC0777A